MNLPWRMIPTACGVVIVLAGLLLFPYSPNRVEIDPERIRERRSHVWFGIVLKSTEHDTWITPGVPGDQGRWIAVLGSFTPPAAATRPELEPVRLIGLNLERMNATGEVKAEVADRITRLIRTGMVDWSATRDALSRAALPLEGQPQTIDELLDLLPRSTD